MRGRKHSPNIAGQAAKAIDIEANGQAVEDAPIAEMTEFLKEQFYEMEEYDEQLVRSLLKKSQYLMIRSPLNSNQVLK